MAQSQTQVPQSPALPKTVEAVANLTKEQLLAVYGNKSNAIRGMAALGMKPGPISKKLGILYQHARNVLSRPLKRVIKEERDAKQAAQNDSSKTK